MAGPFPTGDFGRRTSDNLIGADIGAPAAGVAGAVGAAAEGFGRTLKGMAERAWTREGESDAARAINAENESGIEARIRPGQGIDDQAYNAVVREKRGAERQTAYLDAVSKAKIDHPDNVAGFAEAVGAARAAFAPTGDAQLDVAFDRFRTLADGAALREVRDGEERRRVQTARGAFVTALSSSETLLGQSIASAGFDDQGSALVGASLTEFASSLSRFGPREGFTLNGVEFAADPTRANAVSPEEMGRLFDAAQANARTSWIARAMERAPDAASKQAFAGQVRERYAAGDPAFAGLAAQDMDRLTNRLDAEVASAVATEDAALRAGAAQAREMLEAAEWGSTVDLAQAHRMAVAAGDLGLAAKIEFRQINGFDLSPKELREAAGGGIDALVAAITQVESSGINGLISRDPDGAGPAGGGAYGVMQVLPDTAKRIARRLGLPFDEGRLRTDRAYNTAIGRGYLEDLLGRYQGDEFLAITAYHAGEGNVDGWLRTVGDPRSGQISTEAWLREVERRGNPRSAAYPRKVMAALSARRRSGEGYVNDPLKHAAGADNRRPYVNLPAFDVAGVFTGASDWAAGIRAQHAAGQTLAQRDGVPARTLTNDQVAILKSRIEQDPAAILTLTTRAAETLGEDGARDILAEIGRNPGQVTLDLHVGSLALDAGTAAFAARATEGRRLMAEGASPPKFERGEDIADAQRSIASAYRTMPDLAGPVLATARAAATADAARGDQKSADFYVQSALGRNPYGQHYFGGAADVNGAQTLLPSWVRQDAMDEVLTWVSRAAVAGNWGPVFDNGQPIPVSGLARMQLQAQPDGQYRLINPRTGRPVPNRQGRPWEFDIDTDERHAALRRAMPDLIRPRR